MSDPELLWGEGCFETGAGEFSIKKKAQFTLADQTLERLLQVGLLADGLIP